MSIRHILIILCAGLSLAACQTTRESQQQAHRNFRPAGPYVHALSGMTFPEAVGEFRRTEISQYDPEGLFVKASYDLSMPRGAVTVGVLVYPTDGEPAGPVPDSICAFGIEQQKESLVRAYTGARLVGERDMPVSVSGPQFPGHVVVAEYEDIFNGYSAQLRTEVYFFCSAQQDWAIRYQFIWPPEFFHARDVIDSFIAELPWTMSEGSI